MKIRLYDILYAFYMFLGVMFCHIAVWRLLRPKKHISSLIIVFLVMPVSALTLFYSISSLGVEKYLVILILYLALAGMYIQTYPAIQAWSPTLFITFLIGKNKGVLSISEIKKIINQDNLINDRIEDLVKEGMIQVSPVDKSVSLSLKGNILATIFVQYRKFLSLDEGKG